jgi:hypothetical protein
MNTLGRPRAWGVAFAALFTFAQLALLQLLARI